MNEQAGSSGTWAMDALRRWRWHALAWLAYIAYERLLQLYHGIDPGPALPLAIYYGINILTFYLVAGALHAAAVATAYPYLNGTWRLLLVLAGVLLLKAFADHHFGPATAGAAGQLVPNFIRTMYFCLLGAFYWGSQRISELRRKAAAARNAYLRQQMNPHLLFNALNFIYNSVASSSGDAADCVLLLSDIMRFSLETPGPDDRVALEKEVEQVMNLARINQYRFGGTPALELQISGVFGRHRVIPLILLTLSENVFKHGRLNDPKEPAAIRISVTASGELVFESRNGRKKGPGPARGTGLDNIRLRLDYAYPGRYRLLVSETAEHFHLTLTIRL